MKIFPRINWKYIYVLLLAFSISLICIRNISAADPLPKFYVDPPTIIDTSLQPPKNFTVTIKIANITGLAGIEYKLYWDNSVLEFLSVNDTLPWPPTPFIATNEKTNNYNATHGRFWFVALDLGGNPFTGSATIREITFKVISTGSTALDLIDTLLGNEVAESIPHEVSDGFFSSVLIIPAQLYIQPSSIIDPDLKPPKNFTININTAKAKDLYSFDLKLSYNTTILDATEIKEGSFLKNFGPTIINKMEDNPSTGIIWIAISLVSPAPPASGNGTLATITFQVAQMGESQLRLYETTLKDQNDGELLHETVDGYFNNILLTKLYVDPPTIINPALTPASTFTIDVKIANVTNLYTYEFKLLYDTGFLNGIGILIYPQPANETNFTLRTEIDDRNGIVFVNVTYHSPANPISTITPIKLATITFQVATLGACSLHLNQTKLVDNQGTPMIHTTGDGFVSVAPPDVAILEVTVEPTLIYPGTTVNITVVAANLGIFTTESFNVTTYYGDTEITTLTVTDLLPLTNITLPYSWNTTTILPNDYAISAQASIVPLEENTTNNFLTDGTIHIVAPDVAVINVTPDLTSVYQGWKINVTVIVANQGLLPVTFNVTTYYNDSTIGTQTVINLGSLMNTTLVFLWDTTSVQYCHNYTISGNATTLPSEIDIADNSYADGKVQVRIPGDVNADKTVNMLDLILASNAFGTQPGDPLYNMYADINRDGSINILDMIIISTNLGASC